ncbi:hypothetical protein WJX72_010654 [[Myrmecia] bisecta]|uniref:Prolyl endopeptidase-like n=1 Tax=[Myrmecia] bisecta TaxID=41462 RepID=A0AAW1RAF3_9CHLO
MAGADKDYLPFEDDEEDEEGYDVDDEAAVLRGLAGTQDRDEEGEEDAPEEEDDLFDEDLDPFSLLEGMGEEQGVQDQAALQPFEILANRKRQARRRQKPAGPSAQGEDEAGPSQGATQQDVFGPGVDDIWNDELATSMGIPTAKERKKKKMSAKRRRKNIEKGNRTKQLPEEVVQKLGEANLFYATGRYTEAIELLQEVIRQMPNLPDPYHTLGLLHEAIDNPRKALNFYMIAVHLTPKDISLWKRLAALSTELGFLRNGIYCLGKVLARDKDDLDARWDRAVLYTELNQPRKAVEQFELISAAQGGSNGEVGKVLARLYHQLGQGERAVALLTHFMQDHAGETDLTHINMLAELHMERESWQEAATLVQRAEEALCEEGGLPIDLQVKAGMCALHLGDIAQALPHFHALLGEPVGQFVDLDLDVADALLAHGEYAEASAFYERVRAMPTYNSPALWSKIVQCQRATGDESKAVDIYIEVLGDHGVPYAARSEAALALAELYFQMRQTDAALEVLHMLDGLEADRAGEAGGPGQPSDAMAVAMRKANVLLKLGQQEAFLDLMLPVVSNTLRHFEVAGGMSSKSDPKIAKALRRRARLAHKRRITALHETDGVFKGYTNRDRRKPHVREADEAAEAILAAATDAETEGEEEGGGGGGGGRVMYDLQRSQEQFEMLVRTAYVCLQQRRWQQAQALMTASIDMFAKRWLDKSKKDVLKLVLAEAAFGQADYSGAFGHLRPVCTRWPHSLPVWNTYARVVSGMGGVRQNIKFLMPLRQKHPTSVPLMLLVAHCHAVQGAYSTALGELFHAYRLAPREPLTLLCIGVAYINQAMSKKVLDRDHAVLQAFAFLQEYAEYRLNPQEAAYNIGRAAHQLGLVHIAVPYYEKALSMPAPSADMGGLVAGLLLNRGQAQHQAKQVLKGNFRLLSSQERRVVSTLIAEGHGHLFSNWPPPGVKDAQKRALVRRAASYLESAGTALDDSRIALLEVPQAEQRPKQLEGPNGDVREDSYYWLRDDERTNPEVLAHLKVETAYAKQVLADTEQLQEALYNEMRGRIQEADQSAPQRHEGYYYYSRTLEGEQYRVHCRRRVPPLAGPATEADEMDVSQAEEVLLDENKEAAKHPFYIVSGFEVSPDHRLLAYGEDTKGGEMYTLHVRDLGTGQELLAEPIQNTAGNVAWANDNQTLFYVTKDKLDRPCRVWRHTIGSDPKTDALVYHEMDDAFYISIHRSRSDKLLVIDAGSAVTSEVRILDASNPTGQFEVIRPRENEVEYSIAHRGEHLYITLRDKKRPNSELLVAPLADPSKTKVLLPHRKDVKIESVCVCKDFLALFERVQGLQVAMVYRLPADLAPPSQLVNGVKVPFDEPAYELGPGSQGDFDSAVLRLVYSSLATPATTVDYNMATNKQAVKKVTPVLGGFDKANYITQRLWATAPDGVKVPISLVYRPDLVKLDGSAPMLLNGYGSYEICNDPYFKSDRLSLVDRGFVFGIAHVRGGGEMGRSWYEDGKYLKKKNTFTDFIACAEHLIQHKYTSQNKLCIEGRSAGGLTMGAVTNMRPDLFNAVIMGVPFVDCLTTMLDETIPLTVIEWEEWGNPQKPEFYEYMKSYSPVDNVQETAYPNILVTAGLHDPRVGYWEPAKLVCKLRDHKTDNNLLLFKCDLGAGHFSQSGRFDRLKETALDFAFLLKCQNMAIGKRVRPHFTWPP